MRRRLVVSGAVLAVLAVVLIGYLRIRPAPAGQQPDVAVSLAFSLRVLLTDDPNVALTNEQVKAILPLLRVLRDTDPADEAASRALAEEIRNRLTPEQRAAIARMREDAQAQRPLGQAPQFGPGGPSGPGGPGVLGRPGAIAGAGGPGSTRADLRRQILTRLIERLQSRV